MLYALKSHLLLFIQIQASLDRGTEKFISLILLLAPIHTYGSSEMETSQRSLKMFIPTT